MYAAPNFMPGAWITRPCSPIKAAAPQAGGDRSYSPAPNLAISTPDAKLEVWTPPPPGSSFPHASDQPERLPTTPPTPSSLFGTRVSNASDTSPSPAIQMLSRTCCQACGAVVTCHDCERPALLPRPVMGRQKLPSQARTVSSPLPMDQLRLALAASFRSSPALPPASRTERADDARVSPQQPSSFEPYGPPRTLAEVNEDVLKGLRTFGERHQEPSERGSLYILSHPHDQRFVKIGYTAGPSRSRLRGQRQACRELFEIVHDPRQRRFAGAKAVDDVLKRALHKRRYRLACPACSRVERVDGRVREHWEWYRLPQHEALNMVETWRGWIERCRPFDEKGRLSMYWSWRLRKVEEAQIGTVCWEHILVAPSRWSRCCFVVGVIATWVGFLREWLLGLWPSEAVGGPKVKSNKPLSTSRSGNSMTWLLTGLAWCFVQARHGWLGIAMFGMLGTLCLEDFASRARRR